jgi:hypothetical protein
MPKRTTTGFVGLDVHEDSISVAYAGDDSPREPVFLGPIGTRRCDIDEMVRRLRSMASRLVFADEAGPGGYVLYRYLTRKSVWESTLSPSERVVVEVLRCHHLDARTAARRSGGLMLLLCGCIAS